MAFDLAAFEEALKQARIVYRVHAIQRMFARSISKTEVHEALDRPSVIEDYPDDKPYASALLLGLTLQGRPLHVVCAMDEKRRVIIITVYQPDPERWERDWKTRKERR